MKLSKLLLPIVFLLVAGPASLAKPVDLTLSIDGLLASPKLKHGVQGVAIRSLRTGKVLYDRNGDNVFIPASNFKLVVSAAALDCLGPAFAWPTRVYRTGDVTADGTLHGDLVLVGGGDPVLTTPDLGELAEAVRGSGIRRITGVVAGDDTWFDDLRLGEGWAWSDEPYYYSAEISALNLDENVVKVYVDPGDRPGTVVVVRVDSPTPYLTVRCTATTGETDSADTLTVDREHGRNVIRISGSTPLGKKHPSPREIISVVDPAFYAASTFRSELKSAGVGVGGRAITYRLPKGATLLAEHRSPPLSDVLPLLLKPSDNLIAEVLFKTLGAETSGVGSAATAEKAELAFLKQAGLDLGAISIVDGSGLSRRNYISPDNLTALLTHMWGHKYARVYIDSLPIAGVDGTLKKRMKGTAAQGNVRAKTGYVSRVSCLSGYVTTADGEPLVFSIMMNGHLCPNTDATAVQDKICELLASYRTQPQPTGQTAKKH